MIDFHTHILPDIDDGSDSVEQSVRMIEILLEQGVKKIVLTPHFYAYRSSVDRFSDKREASLKKLTEALKERKINVELYLGSEVLFFEELWRVEEIGEFCIKGTDCILIEMPFSSWENSMVESVINITNRGITPILAHFDRYLKYKGNLAKIREMMRAGVLVQMNCDYLNNFFTRGKAVKFIKRGSVFALGTDCHDIDKRRPEFKSADEYLRKKLDKRIYDRFYKLQDQLIKSAKIVYP